MLLLRLRTLCSGCAWHGCPCTYDDDDICPNGKTAALNREEYEMRRAEIEKVMDVSVVWECEVDEMLSRNEEMRHFYEQCHDTGPLNPKDAYVRIRTH